MTPATCRLLVAIGTALCALHWLITPNSDHYLIAVVAGALSWAVMKRAPNGQRVVLVSLCAAVCAFVLAVDWGVL